MSRPSTIPVHARPPATREQTLAAVLTRVVVEGPISRTAMAEVTGYSSTTITRAVADLVTAGILAEVDSTGTEPPVVRAVGRPTRPVGFVPGSRLAVGVHLHRHHTSATLFDLTGSTLAVEIAEHSDEGPEEHLEAGVDCVRRLLAQAGDARVLGVGLGLGGVVDSRRQLAVDWPGRRWRGVDVGAPYRALGHALLVDGSTRCLAQLWAIREPTTAGRTLTVAVDGSVTAAVVSEGQVQRGPTGMAGMILHFPVADGPGRRCSCGRLDCLGVLASNRALADLAREAGVVGPDVPWNRVSELASADHPGLSALRRRRAEWLGEAVGALAEAVDPDRVVVTGWLGDDDDVAHCLDVVSARGLSTLGHVPWEVAHRDLTGTDWDEVSASLVVGAYLASPARFEPGLL